MLVAQRDDRWSRPSREIRPIWADACWSAINKPAVQIWMVCSGPPGWVGLRSVSGDDLRGAAGRERSGGIDGPGWPAADSGGGADSGPSVSEGSPGGVVIRTPDQRLRVFVSSTLGELAAERRAVARAISAQRLTPVMFELGAQPHPPREVYRAYLAQSDVFIGLYWQRYGQLGPGMQFSGVEYEFELALELPRLLYVKTPAPDR